MDSQSSRPSQEPLGNAQSSAALPIAPQSVADRLAFTVAFGQDPASGIEVVQLQAMIPPLTTGGHTYLEQLAAWLREELLPALPNGGVATIERSSAESILTGIRIVGGEELAGSGWASKFVRFLLDNAAEIVTLAQRPPFDLATPADNPDAPAFPERPTLEQLARPIEELRRRIANRELASDLRAMEENLDRDLASDLASLEERLAESESERTMEEIAADPRPGEETGAALWTMLQSIRAGGSPPALETLAASLEQRIRASDELEELLEKALGELTGPDLLPFKADLAPFASAFLSGARAALDRVGILLNHALRVVRNFGGDYPRPFGSGVAATEPPLEQIRNVAAMLDGVWVGGDLTAEDLESMRQRLESALEQLRGRSDWPAWVAPVTIEVSEALDRELSISVGEQWQQDGKLHIRLAVASASGGSGRWE